MGKYMTVKEAAELYRVTPQTIYSWVDRGLLDVMRLGRTIRVMPTDTGPRRDRDVLASTLASMGDTPGQLAVALEKVESLMDRLDAERAKRDIAAVDKRESDADDETSSSSLPRR